MLTPAEQFEEFMAEVRLIREALEDLVVLMEDE